MSVPGPMDEWLAEHEEDALIVGLLDMMRLAARLAQVAEHYGDAYDPEQALRQMKALRTLCEVELPRLEAVLPPEALAIVAEEIR